MSVGLRLGLKSAVLKGIDADFGTVRERFRVVLEKWLVLDVNVTWHHLEMAITNARREEVGLNPLTDGKSLIIVVDTLYSLGLNTISHSD